MCHLMAGPFVTALISLGGCLSRGGVGGGLVYLFMCLAVVVYLIYC